MTSKRCLFVYLVFIVLSSECFASLQIREDSDRELTQTWPTHSPVKSSLKKKPDHKDGEPDHKDDEPDHENDEDSSSPNSNNVSSGRTWNDNSSSSGRTWNDNSSTMSATASTQSQNQSSFMVYLSGAIMVGAAIVMGVIRQTRRVTFEREHPLAGSIAKRASVFATFAGKAKGGLRPPREMEFELRDDKSGFGLDDSSSVA